MATARILSTFAAVALFSVSGAALAQEETNRVAAETDWAVFEGDEPKECWAVTAPRETVNTRDDRVVSVRRVLKGRGGQSRDNTAQVAAGTCQL